MAGSSPPTRVSQGLYDDAKLAGEILSRSTAQQIDQLEALANRTTKLTKLKEIIVTIRAGYTGYEQALASAKKAKAFVICSTASIPNAS